MRSLTVLPGPLVKIWGTRFNTLVTTCSQTDNTSVQGVATIA